MSMSVIMMPGSQRDNSKKRAVRGGRPMMVDRWRRYGVHNHPRSCSGAPGG
jgi:hypothetical protein